MSKAMERQEWIRRCSARLHVQWPTVPLEQLVDVAAEIQRQLEDPEEAALGWLRQGIPNIEVQRNVG